MPGIGTGVQALMGQVIEHIGVLDAVGGFLAHEALDVLEEALVPDQRQGLFEDLDEPSLARGEQQMQHIDDMSGSGLVRYPQQRSLRPVE